MSKVPRPVCNPIDLLTDEELIALAIRTKAKVDADLRSKKPLTHKELEAMGATNLTELDPGEEDAAVTVVGIGIPLSERK